MKSIPQSAPMKGDLHLQVNDALDTERMHIPAFKQGFGIHGLFVSGIVGAGMDAAWIVEVTYWRQLRLNSRKNHRNGNGYSRKHMCLLIFLDMSV